MFLVIPLLLTGGCDDAAVLQSSMPRQQIRFGVEDCGSEGFSTKADFASASSLTRQGFNVSCFCLEIEGESFSNLPASWSPALSCFCIDALWGEDSYSFSAVYPPSLHLLLSGTIWKIDVGSEDQPWDGSTDIMAAACYGKARTYGAIPLKFEHIMACLEGFKVIPDSNDEEIGVNVSSVSVSAPAYGSYAIPTDQGLTGAWASGGSRSLVFQEGCPLMLIPDPEGYQFDVRYTVLCDGQFYRELSASARIVLPAGQRSTVLARLPLKGGKMHFDVSADNWNEGIMYETTL